MKATKQKKIIPIGHGELPRVKGLHCYVKRNNNLENYVFLKLIRDSNSISVSALKFASLYQTPFPLTVYVDRYPANS